jgi:hypothetical protein
MDWKLEIEKVGNGYICRWREDDDGDGALGRIRRLLGTCKEYKEVFSIPDIRWGEVSTFQEVLCFVTDHFGMTGSKHDARRIRIETGEDDVA